MNFEENPHRDDLLDCASGRLLGHAVLVSAICFAVVLAGLFVGRTVAWFLEYLKH